MKICMFLISFLFICATAGYAQNIPGGTVYLFFDDSCKKKCQQHKLKKFRKVDTGDKLIFFYVCSELFVFNKEGSIPDTTSIKNIPSEKIVDINEMIKKYKSLEPQQFKHHVYDTVYIVEKLQKGQVLIRRVGWNDSSLGIVE